MQDPKDLPEIPDIKLPDPTSPAHRKTGFILAALTGALSTCCVAILAAGLAFGAISFNRAAAPRGISTVDPRERTSAQDSATVPVYDNASVTATPGAPAGPIKVTGVPKSSEAPALEDTPTAPATVIPVIRTTPQPTAAPIVNVPRETTERQLRVFDTFWQTVSENYVYSDFNGVDWSAQREVTQARIEQGMTDAAFHDMLGMLITRLGDEHSHYLSPEDAREEDKEYNGTLEFVGVGIITEPNVEKGYISVLQVFSNSPADKAGIRAHDHILQIDGLPIIDANGVVQSGRFRGPPNTTVNAIIRTPGQEPRAVSMTRAKINAQERVEFRLLEGGGRRFGYILIPTLFEDDIDERVRSALRTLYKREPLDGIIIDMRINGGGALNVLQPTLGFFTRGDIGRLVNRKGTRQTIGIRAENIDTSQRIPLAVLIGPSTESYAEVFAGALQAKNRALLIGLETAGNIETLRAHEFEDGARLWLAEESFRLMDGNSWEGKGLTPDIRVTARWDEFTAENDPVINAAVKALIESVDNTGGVR